ncbi:MAG: T9SS type A sorting domain-containing protein [Flavobacteriia bacterium]|nr:T9SS type A sorting domain-containing protein [Flavobacteriia bacterium]
MKKCLFVLFVLSFLNLYAQTLTNSLYMSGTITPTNFYIGNFASFNTSLLTINGSNVTWDASGLTRENATPEVHLTYVASSLTPYYSEFTNTNYTTYDPDLTTFIAYEYYLINSDSLVSFGNYNISGNHEVFQNPDKHLIFPFQYGQSFTDTYAKTNYSDATTISSYQNGNRTVEFVGHGTLILPQGSFSNVAMIYELRTNNLGPNSTEYTWYDLNTGKRILYYAENDGNLTLAYSSSSNSSSINENNLKLKSYLFPTISNGQFEIRNKSDLKIEDIKVYNLNGQIQDISVGSIFENKFRISTNLSNGTYFIKIVYSDKSSEIQRFIVER